MSSEIINGFSVDVEDWYQVSDFEDKIPLDQWDRYESRVVPNTRRILKLLKEFDVRGTFFILTWNAVRHPDLVQEISEAGHEIATHGHTHRLVYEQGRELFEEDLLQSLEILRAVPGVEVLGYRAPSFSVTAKSLWALDVMVDAGLTYDSSVFPVQDPLYGIPGAQRFPFTVHESEGRKLAEFPMTTMAIGGRNFPLGGGAYLRLLPYKYMQWGMRRVHMENQPAVVYLHPWEIDPEQPRLPIKGKRGFSTHYWRLEAMEPKLRRLLSDFRFAPIRDVLTTAGHLAGPEIPVLPATDKPHMMNP